MVIIFNSTYLFNFSVSDPLRHYVLTVSRLQLDDRRHDDRRLKPSIKIVLLTVPWRCFFCKSYMLFLSCLLCFNAICLLMPCGHLLGKG